MKRRNFIKSIFGGLGVLSVSPAISNTYTHSEFNKIYKECSNYPEVGVKSYKDLKGKYLLYGHEEFYITSDGEMKLPKLIRPQYMFFIHADHYQMLTRNLKRYKKSKLAKMYISSFAFEHLDGNKYTVIKSRDFNVAHPNKIITV